MGRRSSMAVARLLISILIASSKSWTRRKRRQGRIPDSIGSANRLPASLAKNRRLLIFCQLAWEMIDHP
jgi:hypothetical protein